MFHVDEYAIVVGLGLGGGVGIILGGTSEKIDGGCTGLRFPRYTVSS